VFFENTVVHERNVLDREEIFWGKRASAWVLYPEGHSARAFRQWAQGRTAHGRGL